MATETLQELLVRIRTVGEQEAKAALARAVTDAQREQSRLARAQEKEAQRAKDAKLKALTDEMNAEGRSDKQRQAAIKAFNQYQAAEQKNRDRQRIAQERATQRELAKAIKDGQREISRIEEKQARDRQAAQDAGRTGFMSGGQKLGDRIVGGALNLGKAAVVAGAGAAVGGFMAFENFLSQTDELKTFAAFTSLTTERLQQLNFAVEQNGMSSEKFADGIRQFNAGVRESAKAGGESGAVAEAVKDLGISFKDLLQMNPEDQLFAILKRGNELGPSFARAGAFAKAFGEIAGAQFARLSDQGVDSLRATAQAAKDLGFVLDTATVDQTVRVNQALKATFSVIGGIKNSIFAELLPIAEEYIAMAREWVLNNRELVKTSTVEWIQQLEKAAKAAWPDVKMLLGLVRDMLPVLVEWAPVLIKIGVGLKGLGVAQQAAASIKTLHGAFVAAQGSALAFAGAGGIGAITQAFLALLPIALKVGDILGDIGSMESDARATLADRILAASRTRNNELAGGEVLRDEIARLSPDERTKLENEVLKRVSNRRRVKNRGTAAYSELFAGAERDFALSEAEKNEKGALFNKLMNSRQKIKTKQLDWLVAEGQLTQEQSDLVRGRQSVGALTGSRKKEKDDKLSDAELMKLIDKAVQSGANLQDLIGQRKLAGTTPPVITITQHIYNVTATANMTLKQREGQSADSFAQAVIANFNELLSGEIRKATPHGAVSR